MLNLKLAALFILFYLNKFSNGQDLASAINTFGICAGTSKTIKCDPTPTSTYTIIFDQALYGIKSSTTCDYNSGDCYTDATSTISSNNCGTTLSSCIVSAGLLFKIPDCNDKYAQYLSVAYNCVPVTSTSIKTFDICGENFNDITQSNGFITSPGFPSFTTTDQCTRKISAPADKVINIWIVDMSIRPDTTQICANDFVKITDTTGVYKICGSKKVSYQYDLCSSQVYISYKTASSGSYRGFKMYYEFADRSLQPDCSTETPPYPSITTTLSTTTYIPQLTDAIASDIKLAQVCIGTEQSIDTPKSFILYISSIYYGVPKSLTCDPISSGDCKAPVASFSCPLQGTCKISLKSDIPVIACALQPAKYIAAEYRFLPLYSTRNFSICSGSDIDGSVDKYGILTSTNYPKWQTGLVCARKIVAPVGKVIRAYVSDMSIDGPTNGVCTSSYISFQDDTTETRYCGIRLSTGTFSVTSCSNTLSLTYASSNFVGVYFTGVNVYYEIIDQGSITCSPSGVTTTTKSGQPQSTTTPQPQEQSISSLILTNGGNSFGAPCKFPFIYKQTSYDTCINLDQNDYWCSTTSNYDVDMKRGFCNLGLTSTVGFDLCPKNVEDFYCPKGFNIYILAAEYGVTSDGSCDYKKKVCSVSGLAGAQVCLGKEFCKISHSARTIPECSNKPSNFLHIEYTCIPNNVQGVPVIDICTAQSTSEPRGILQSTKFPNYQANQNCQFTLNIPDNKIVNVYTSEFYIKPAPVGQDCQTDALTMDDGVRALKVCGNIKTDLLYRSCSNRIQFSLVTGTSTSILYKGVKVFYEILDKTAQTVCEIATPQPISTTTISAVQPLYVQQGISASFSKSICKNNYLDILTGANIKCPNNYIIVIRDAFHGIAKANECFYKNGDCTSRIDNPALICNGKTTCTVLYFSKSLPECFDAMSSYLEVRFDCIPINHPKKPMCGQTFTDQRGIISTPNYPNYEQLSNCPVTIRTNNASIIVKAYIIDMSIGPQDLITFLDPANITFSSYTDQQSAVFAIETCLSELNINLKTQSTPDGSLSGALIYYEAIPKPIDFVCQSLFPTNATTKPTTTTTTKSTTTLPTKPAYYGMASNVIEVVTCKVSNQIDCPADYVIVPISVEYRVSEVLEAGCTYSPIDCSETTTTINYACAGKTSCSFVYSSRAIASCGNRKSSYIYMTYQCVPVTSAGAPLAPSQDLCNAAGTFSPIYVENSMLIQSPEYPKYPTVDKMCRRDVNTASGRALKVYLVVGLFKGSGTSCNAATNDFVKISDCIESYSICGNLNHAKLLMQSVSNTISLDYSISALAGPQNIFNKGFQLYIESVPSNDTCNTVNVTSYRSSTTIPPLNGLASHIYHHEVCSLTDRTFHCPVDYYLIVLQEEYVYSGRGCRHSDRECYQPTDLAFQKCSAQSQCTIYLPQTPLSRCSNNNADFLDIEYQCVPAFDQSVKSYTCGDSVKNMQNGFISSPNYPNYQSELGSCEIKIQPKEDYGYRIYLIDLALSDPAENGSCLLDYIKINDEEPLCGIDLPRLFTVTNNVFKISFKSLNEQQATTDESLTGFKFYFEEYPLHPATVTSNPETRPPRPSQTRENKLKTEYDLSRHKEQSSSLTNWSLGLGIPFFIVIIAVVILIMRKSVGTAGTSNSTMQETRINFSNKKNKDIDDIKSFENPNFSSDGSLYDRTNLNLSHE